MINKKEAEALIEQIDKFSSYFVSVCSMMASNNLTSTQPRPQDMIRKATHLHNKVVELKSLLQEEGEEVTRTKVNDFGGGWHYQNRCPNRCGYNLVYLQNYCWHCGQKLLWPDNQNKGEG